MRVYRTDLDGDIALVVRAGALEVVTAGRNSGALIRGERRLAAFRPHRVVRRQVIGGQAGNV